MIFTESTKLLAVWLVVVLAGAAIVSLGMLTSLRSTTARAVELSYLPAGKHLKLAVLGYRHIAADMIWLKVVQHFGDREETKDGYRWTYHAVDVVTDLDPKFVFAYQYAGVTLGLWAGLPQESIAILLKGMRDNPDVWQLPFYIGYDYYFELHDARTAATYLRLASLLPGAPPYLPKLVARMMAEAGTPEAALEFLQRLYEQATDERTRQELVQRMKEVVIERDIQFLEEGIRRYQARHGKRPKQLQDLVRGGIILYVPDEPFGGHYQLDRVTGEVRSTTGHERLRVRRR